MFRTLLARGKLLVLTCVIAFVGGCSKGPSDSQVIKDWGKFRKDENPSILKDVQFKKAEIVGTSVSGNVAEVIVRITGDWIGDSRSSGWIGQTACGGFNPAKGQNQVVERKFIYKKFDSGWRLEENQLIH